MSPGDPSDAVFADRQVLLASHRPDRFEHRDAELAALRTVLSPAILSGGTATALLCGPPAQGKRTATALACKKLGSKSGTTDALLVPIECPTGATAYKLAIAATNALRGEDALAESGYRRETAFRRLRGRIRDAESVPILRFDHVQRVEPAELEVFLAGLLDATGEGSCGIVAVADGLQYRNALPVETRRRMDQELFFSPYDRSQRRSIVEDRVTSAFESGTCPDAAIDQCLSFAERTDAPLRTAFEILRHAGDEVVQAGAHSITPDHLERAHASLKQDRLIEILAECSLHERQTLAALMSVDDGRFESIYDTYRRRCREDDVSPNRERSVHNYLDVLVNAALVEATEERSSTGGRYFEYSLVPEAALVEDAFDVLDEWSLDGGAGSAGRIE